MLEVNRFYSQDDQIFRNYRDLSWPPLATAAIGKNVHLSFELLIYCDYLSMHGGSKMAITKSFLKLGAPDFAW